MKYLTEFDLYKLTKFTYCCFSFSDGYLIKTKEPSLPYLLPSEARSDKRQILALPNDNSANRNKNGLLQDLNSDGQFHFPTTISLMRSVNPIW